jgi:hypothetical protein
MAVFFASLPWLADIDETVTLSITAAVMMSVLAWASFFSTRQERSLDEVQLAGQRFAQTKGARGGTIIAVMLLLPTPLMTWVINALIDVTTDPAEPVDGHAVHMGITFGMMLVIVMQSLGTVVANAIWNRRLSDNA